MKAMIYRDFGPADVLHYEEVPDPVPGPGEIVLEVHACSVNRVLDVAVRAGKQPQRHVQLPHIGGVDPVGIVTALGPGVTDRKIGDTVAVFQGLGERRMFGIHCWGGNAQFTKAPVFATCVVPKGVSFADACVLARHAPVAWNLLVRMGKLQPGEWVLVMGAAGNLGSIGIQLAKNLGARVIACAGSDERARLGRELGADHAINYKNADLKDEVMRITHGKGVDLVYDNIANPEPTAKAIEALGFDGRLVTAGAHGGPVVPVNFFHVYDHRITIMGSPVSRGEDAMPALNDAAAGKMRVLVERVMPLAEAVAAHRLVESSPATGKIILDPSLG
ncbi:MAG TPA: zinc-binding dehydrogenase [Stellaceae bacterium]|nr:zinc-binding dehydrogenase [Stellaceae bacterium]